MLSGEKLDLSSGVLLSTLQTLRRETSPRSRPKSCQEAFENQFKLAKSTQSFLSDYEHVQPGQSRTSADTSALDS
jgi:hypothetical protein